MKVMVIGSGGREHALCWKLAASPEVSKVFGAPQIAGLSLLDKGEPVAISTPEELADFAASEKIDLTVVGPEDWLANGIVDLFQQRQLRIFGPSRHSARLESSKSFAKSFMMRNGVKTPRSLACASVDEAMAALGELAADCSWPLVIKADGLAAGKGVVIVVDRRQAEKTINEIMVDSCFGEAGKNLVIEEFIDGFEASIICFCDRDTMLPMLPVRDHKRIREGDQGPNTGGMGTIAPHPWWGRNAETHFQQDILQPTLAGLRAENLTYNGFLFFGLIINRKGVYLLEYNVRAGDPETQALLPLLQNDLYKLINDAVDNGLNRNELSWLNQVCCCVIAAAEGYPSRYNRGDLIEGINENSRKLFLAGVSRDQNGCFKTDGGRVLGAIGLGADHERAATDAYDTLDTIHFRGKTFRRDIGS